MSIPENSDEKTVSYEVWQRGVGAFAGTPERRTESDLTKRYALTLEGQYNDEEAENARVELRKVKREFFAVKVTSTRKAVA